MADDHQKERLKLHEQYWCMRFACWKEKVRGGRFCGIHMNLPPPGLPAAPKQGPPRPPIVPALEDEQTHNDAGDADDEQTRGGQATAAQPAANDELAAYARQQSSQRLLEFMRACVDEISRRHSEEPAGWVPV